MRRNYQDARDAIDSAGVPLDGGTDAREICLVARDAIMEGRHDDAVKLVAAIPPVKLGRTLYRVACGGRHGFELVGPRGGGSSLVQNLKNPALWAHNTMAGHKCRTQWYRREADGTFTAF